MVVIDFYFSKKLSLYMSANFLIFQIFKKMVVIDFYFSKKLSLYMSANFLIFKNSKKNFKKKHRSKYRRA